MQLPHFIFFLLTAAIESQLVRVRRAVSSEALVDICTGALFTIRPGNDTRFKSVIYNDGNHQSQINNRDGTITADRFNAGQADNVESNG